MPLIIPYPFPEGPIIPAIVLFNSALLVFIFVCMPSIAVAPEPVTEDNAVLAVPVICVALDLTVFTELVTDLIVEFTEAAVDDTDDAALVREDSELLTDDNPLVALPTAPVNEPVNSDSPDVRLDAALATPLAVSPAPARISPATLLMSKSII